MEELRELLTFDPDLGNNVEQEQKEEQKDENERAVTRAGRVVRTPKHFAESGEIIEWPKKKTRAKRNEHQALLIEDWMLSQIQASGKAALKSYEILCVGGQTMYGSNTNGLLTTGCGCQCCAGMCKKRFQ